MQWKYFVVIYCNLDCNVELKKQINIVQTQKKLEYQQIRAKVY